MNKTAEFGKVVIAPAGNWASRVGIYFSDEKMQTDVIQFVDNNVSLKDTLINCGNKDVRVGDFNELGGISYDYIIVATALKEVEDAIVKQLNGLGASADKIVTLHENWDLYFEVFSTINDYDEKTDARVRWLRDFSEMVYERDIRGSVAECGVYRGDFAHYICKYFPDRRAFFLDTYEGFSDKDIAIEESLGNSEFVNGIFSREDLQFKMNSVDFVKRQVKDHIDRCTFIQGFFPDSVKYNPINDNFCFVNLDMDLYQPMLEGIKYFYPKMVKGGVILLHDYYYPDLPGVKQAVCEYLKTEKNLCLIPLHEAGGACIVKQ